jgi:serine/threonine protein kinase/WD40 repeat protein
VVEPLPCPSANDWRRLLLGRCSDEEAARLEQHLAKCRRCSERLVEVPGEDDLVRATRVPTPPEEQAESHLVQSLIAQVKQLPKLLEATSGPEAQEGGASGPTARQWPSTESECAMRLTLEGTAVLAPPLRDDEIGRLGRYRVLELLGGGGMGVVFRAEDPDLDRRVALKAMLPTLAASPTARQRFLREAKAAAAVKDEHIVHIYEVDEDRGVPFLVMELLEGESLEDRLERRRRLSIEEVLHIGKEVALGLAAAHAKGLIHRDIKPGNIWLEGLQPLQASPPPRSGEGGGHSPLSLRFGGRGVGGEGGRFGEGGERIKLLDFGLVWAVSSDESKITREGALLGTPGYMAPEQLDGQPADPRGDLFSLGCVLYRAATGQLPFDKGDPLATLRAVALASPRAPSEFAPDLPPALNDLILQLLAREPKERPASARQVVEAIESIQRGEGPARPGRRRRWLAAGILTLAALAILIVVLFGRREPLKHPDGASGGSRSPLDDLGPGNIPPAERFDWQPPELVAVFGTHAWRHWGDGVTAECPGLVFTADGKSVLALGSSRRWGLNGRADLFRISDAATGKDRAVFRLSGARLAAWSGNLQRVALLSGTYHDRGVLQVHDVPGNKAALEVEIGSGVAQLILSPDGARIAEGRIQKGTVTLRDGATGKEQWIWKEPGPWIAMGMAFSPDGKRLALVAAVGTPPIAREVKLLDIASKQVTTRDLPAPIQTHLFCALTWSADARFLAVGAKPERGRLFQCLEVSSGKGWSVTKRQAASAIQPPLRAVAFSPDGKTLACAASDEFTSGVEPPAIFLLDTSTGKEQGRLSGPVPSESIAFAPDGKRLAAATVAGDILLWDLAAKKVLNPPSPVGFFDLARDDRTLAATTGPLGAQSAAVAVLPHSLALLDVPTGQVRPIFESPANQLIRGAAFSPDLTTLAATSGASSTGGAVVFLDTSTREPRDTLDARSVGAMGLAYTPDGETLAIAQTGWLLWDVPRHKSRARESTPLTEHGPAPVVSPDGRSLAFLVGGHCRLIGPSGETLPGPDQLLLGRKRWWSSQPAAFSPDGKRLALACRDGAVRVWDLIERKVALVLPAGDVETLTAVAFGPGGHSVISVSGDGRIIQWESQTKRTILQLPGLVKRIAQSSDRRYLFTSNQNGTVYVFRLTTAPKG